MTDNLTSSAMEINVKGGFVALVDAADYDLVRGFAWYVTYSYKKRVKGRIRAVICDVPKSNPLRIKHRRVAMHRLIMGFPYSLIDHKNGSIFDNQRQNLRLATPEQNAWNSKLRKNNTTGIKGVERHKCGKFLSRIEHKRKRTYLGSFDTAEAAGAAYRAAALKLHGEFARLK